jgi:RNA polymerase sigma factor (sigma-70 family)
VGRFTIEQIIKGIRRRDNSVLQYIYKAYYSTVLRLVVSNRGTEHDAKDVFQETIIIVFKNIREDPEIEITCTFQTYIYSIARLIWLKQLKTVKESDEIRLVESHSHIVFEEPKPFTDVDIEYALFQKAFLQLPPDCQQIIKMSIDGFSQKEICQKMSLMSENYISKRKHYCKEYLIRIIKEKSDSVDS